MWRWGQDRRQHTADRIGPRSAFEDCSKRTARASIMISIDLSGKTILITGALGAIAEHMVKRLAASGATLMLTDIKKAEQAHRTLADWQIPSSSYLYFAADITDSSQLESVVRAMFDKFP